MNDKFDLVVKSENKLNLELENEVQKVVTSNYPELNNLPKINDVTLVDNKTSDDLGLQPAGDYANTRVTNLEIDALFK